MPKHQHSSSSKVKAVRAILERSQSVSQVARAFDVHRSNVYRWVDQYQKSGSLERAKNSAAGRQAKLCGAHCREVLRILKSPASDFGWDTDFWTTRRIAQAVKKVLGMSVSRMAIHRLLTKYQLSYKTPEPRYYEADPVLQKHWQETTAPLINETVRKYRAILYFEDESSISLTPTVAKTWAPRGNKIIYKVTSHRGSISAISAISRDGRLLFNVHDGNKRYNASDIVSFLTQMLRHHPRRHLVVVMDQAPCHRAKLVRDFIERSHRLHVFYLPPRSPEFNPDEKLWAHLKNQELKSHQAKSQRELKTLTSRKLREMSRKPSLVRGIYRRSEAAVLFS